VSAPLTEVDPEVAATAFGADLVRFWEGGRPFERGWKRTDVDALTSIVEMPGHTPEGGSHPHLVKLEGHFYPEHPPRVLFVVPGTHAEAPGDSPWFPRTDPGGADGRPQWFGLHSVYDYPDGTKRQLVCFSQSLDFYISDHNPSESEAWRQGVHTLAATLNRLHEILSPVYYRGPAGELQAAA
jgi:hypothetical protein